MDIFSNSHIHVFSSYNSHMFLSYRKEEGICLVLYNVSFYNSIYFIAPSRLCDMLMNFLSLICSFLSRVRVYKATALCCTARLYREWR